MSELIETYENLLMDLFAEIYIPNPKNITSLSKMANEYNSKMKSQNGSFIDSKQLIFEGNITQT